MHPWVHLFLDFQSIPRFPQINTNISHSSRIRFTGMNLHLNHNVLFDIYQDSGYGNFSRRCEWRLWCFLDTFLERRYTSYTCYTWQTSPPRDPLSLGAFLVSGHHPEWFRVNLISITISIIIRGEEDHAGCWSITKSFKAETDFSSVYQYKLCR